MACNNSILPLVKPNFKVCEIGCKIIKKKSEDALHDVPNNLDLVYIDGNHTYPFVQRDIANYWPKIKVGGWLTGDDYYESGVNQAVNEFVEKNGLKLQVLAGNWAIQR